MKSTFQTLVQQFPRNSRTSLNMCIFFKGTGLTTDIKAIKTPTESSDSFLNVKSSSLFRCASSSSIVTCFAGLTVKSPSNSTFLVSKSSLSNVNQSLGFSNIFDF